MKIVAIVALCAAMFQPAASCNVATIGRVSLGVDGLTDGCCTAVSSSVDGAMAAMPSPGPEHGETIEDHDQAEDDWKQYQGMMVAMAVGQHCCGAADQDVLGSLIPQEGETPPPGHPTAAQMVQQGCAMMSKGKGKGKGGPPANMDMLQLLGVKDALARSGLFAKAETQQSMAWTTTFLVAFVAAVVGGFGVKIMSRRVVSQGSLLG